VARATDAGKPLPAFAGAVDLLASPTLELDVGVTADAMFVVSHDPCPLNPI